MKAQSHADYARAYPERDAQRLLSAIANCGKMWAERYERMTLFHWPCWELVVGGYWEEDWATWIGRWRKLGGKVFEETRLIAAKWDPIWGQISASFDDGIGRPFPPYAISSCASWRVIDADESIALGVITEEDYESHQQPPRDNREVASFWNSMTPEQQAQLMEELGLNKTRAERYAERKKTNEEAKALSQQQYADYVAERERDRVARNDVFKRLEKMDVIFSQLTRSENADVLMEELQFLMNATVFDRYHKCRARAVRYAAILLEESERYLDALEYYSAALAWDPRQPVKRRIAAMKKRLAAPAS